MNEVHKLQDLIEIIPYQSWLLLFLFQLEANETEGRKNRIRPEFKEDPSFKNRFTSYNHTAVHIPTDIYDGCK